MSQQILSGGTYLTIAVGLVISFFYLRYMWAALKKSVRTRDEPDDSGQDVYHRSLFGAILAVVVASLSIAVYGAGPSFLYWGPILALLSAIAVAYCLYQESAP